MHLYDATRSRGSSTNVVTKLRQKTEDSEFDSRKQQILIYPSRRLDSLGIHPASRQGMLWDFIEYVMQQAASVVWPLVLKFAGSHPAEAVGFLGRSRGSKAVGPMS